eukprot:m.142493 g.142493  ORF g.142493 m.142493 type:complete len:866 (+) comp16160_c0_seq1:343-2940(+)
MRFLYVMAMLVIAASQPLFQLVDCSTNQETCFRIHHPLLQANISLEAAPQLHLTVPVYHNGEQIPASVFESHHGQRYWHGNVTNSERTVGNLRVVRSCHDVDCQQSSYSGFIHLDNERTLEIQLAPHSQQLQLSVANNTIHASTPLPAMAACAQHSGHEVPADELHRHRRAGPASQRHTQCLIALDCDASFVVAWGNGGTAQSQAIHAATKMLDIVFQVEAVYQYSRNLQGIVSLRVASINVNSLLDLFASQPLTSTATVTSTETRNGLEYLDNYQAWLGIGQEARGSSSLAFNEVCLNHGFTHTNLNGVLGVAIQASPAAGVIGGLCADRSINGRALNAGISSTMTSSNTGAASWQMVLSTAHEIGHNLGASHTCEFQGSFSAGQCDNIVGSDPCNPSDAQGGPFIMYPAVAADDSHPNARSFSSCSLAAITDVVLSKGECLVEPHPCDTPGSCCLGQHLLPAGTTCLDHEQDESAVCMQAPLCDGLSATCPAQTPKPDGALCSTATLLHGVCVSGVCQRPFTTLCASIGLDACVLPQASCMPACINNSLLMAPCRPFSTACGVDASPATGAVDGILSSSSCPEADGTPCVQPDQSVGICGGNVCLACDASCQEALSMDVEVVECNISISARAVCSEPCGGGQQTVSYDCLCQFNGIPLVAPESACGNPVVPAGELVSCGLDSCQVDKAQNVQVKFVRSDSNSPLTDGLVLILRLEKVLGWPLDGSVKKDGGDDITIVVSSCRRADDDGCLSAETLLNRLAEPSVAREVLVTTGYEYSAKREPKDNDRDLVFYLALGFGLAAGIMLLVVLYLLFMKPAPAPSKAGAPQQRQASAVTLISVQTPGDSVPPPTTKQGSVPVRSSKV